VLHEVIVQDTIPPLVGTAYELPEVTFGCTQSSTTLLQLLPGVVAGIWPRVTDAEDGDAPAASATVTTTTATDRRIASILC
jgi:hypothetical protein